MAKEVENPKIITTMIRGIPFPGPPFQPSIMESIFNFKPDPTDIFVVTYPKCGTTWTQYIVWEIVNKGISPPTMDKMLFKEFPFLEVTGVDILKDATPPRLMKTHLPFHLQPFDSCTKYVYVARNPWDSCVSFFFHTKQSPGTHPDLTFDEFFDMFLEGKLPYGDYFDHVLLWYSHRNDPNVLFLTYEELKKDTKSAILNIARFLGESYFDALENDEEMMNNCLKYTDFKYMKENMKVFFPKEQDPADTLLNTFKSTVHNLDGVDSEKYKQWEFFRKGVVGDWKNHFTETHKQRFNEYMLKKIRGTEMEEFWSPLQEDAGRQE